jgi:hypothetical protein
MANTFIDISILLKHRSQIAKCVFLGYHLTIESNIPLLLRDSVEITLHILCFRLTKTKIFCLQSPSAQFQLLGNPHPTLIHQNHIIRKEHAPRDATLYVSCDPIHHQSKKIRAQSRPLIQSYINWKDICVFVTCSDTCHNIIIHILNEGNVLC